MLCARVRRMGLLHLTILPSCGYRSREQLPKSGTSGPERYARRISLSKTTTIGSGFGILSYPWAASQNGSPRSMPDGRNVRYMPYTETNACNYTTPRCAVTEGPGGLEPSLVGPAQAEKRFVINFPPCLNKQSFASDVGTNRWYSTCSVHSRRVPESETGTETASAADHA